MVNIKVEHKESVRRFALPPNASWIDLEGKLRTLFNIPTLTPFTLSYTDEDNDIITLSTDIELHEIFRASTSNTDNPTVKFNLKFSISDDSSDSEGNSDVWVFESGPHKGAASTTTIETDTSGLQNNVSQKNIISTTNQEPQYTDNDIIEEASNKKVLVDDDFEKVEKSSNDITSQPGSTWQKPFNCPIEGCTKSFTRHGHLSRHIQSCQSKQETAEKPVTAQNPSSSESSTNAEAETSPVLRPTCEEPVIDVERVENSAHNVERVENSAHNVESVERLPNDVESVERSSNDVESVERSSNDVESVERSSNDVESVERSPNDVESVEKSPSGVDRVEKSSSNVEKVEKSPKDADLSVERKLFLERISNDSDRVEDVVKVESSSNKKISRVNLLDDEFFESFNTRKISSNIEPFSINEPKPIPQPQLQREVEDEQEDEEIIGTLSSSSFSPLSERIQPQQRRQDDIEELKEFIEKFAKKDPQLTASVIDEIRTSIHVDNEKIDPFRRPTQSKEDKRNTYFRQHSITSPISGRSRSATPPRSGFNRSSTPPEYNRSSISRSGYNHNRSSTPPRSGYNRSSTPEYNRPPTPEYNRSSTPPILPGSFPVPASTPCLWINENESPRPDSNPNRRGRKGRRGGYRYRSRRNQKNTEQSTNVGEETLDREETPEPEQKENNLYHDDIKYLNEMGFKNYEDQYVELLIRHKGDVNQVIDDLLKQ